MKTCERCGLINPDTSARCECGGSLIAGDPEKLKLRNGAVAGFWIRLVADALDAGFLGIAGWILTMAFRAPLLALGERAVLIGIPISLLYTAVLQSRIGGGQTLAKRLLNLRVVRMDGSLLSFDRAVVRWALIGFLIYGGAAASALLTVAPFLNRVVVSAACTGIQLALFIGCGVLIAFHPLKRGLHDLLTGSMVVRRAMLPDDFLSHHQNPTRDRRLILGAIALAVVTSIAAVLIQVSGPKPEAGPVRALQAVAAIGIQNPSVGETTIVSPGGERRFILAGGFVPGTTAAALDSSDLHDKFVAVIRKELPMNGSEEIRTFLRTGINIGVYSSYETSAKIHAPPATPDPGGPSP